MIKVFITRRLPSIAKEILNEKFEVHESNKNDPYPRDKLPEIVAIYDAVLSTVSERFNKEILGQKGKLKVISNYAVGLDNIDVSYAQSIGITVYNTPDIVTNSTADFTFAILLSLIRKISSAVVFVKQGKWKAWDPELFLGEELFDKVFGIMGFGKIGQAVARRAIAFGLNVIYYDILTKQVDPSIVSCVKSADLNNLLKMSDFISIHIPLTEENRGLINNDLINKMEKKPIILNMSRGDIAVTDDLVDALKEGKIRGAGLDVTSPEPLPGNHPLCHFDNCIVMPHIGTATHECRINMAKNAAQNIINHFSK